MRRPLLPALLALTLGGVLAVGISSPTPSTADVNTATLGSSVLTPGGTVDITGTRSSVDTGISLELRGPTLFDPLDLAQFTDPSAYCANTEVGAPTLSWSCSFTLTDLPTGFARPGDGWSAFVTEVDTANGNSSQEVQLPFTVVLGTPTVTSVSPDPRYRTSTITISGTKDPGTAISVGLYNDSQEYDVDPFADETVFLTNPAAAPTGTTCADVGVASLTGFVRTLSTTWSCTLPVGTPLLAPGTENRILLSQFYTDGGYPFGLSQPQASTDLATLDDRPTPIWTTGTTSTLIEHTLPVPLAGELPFGSAIDLLEIVDNADAFVTTCEVPCSLGTLAPGTYVAESYTLRSGAFSRSVFEYFVIPSAPVIESTEALPTGAFTLVGTADPTSEVLIRDQGGALVCTAPVSPEGTFICTTDPLPAGSYSFAASALDAESTDALSSYTGTRVVGATYRSGITSASSAPTQLTPSGSPPVVIDPPATVDPEPVAPQPVEPEPVAPEPIAPPPGETEPIAPLPVAPEPVNPEPISPQPEGPEPSEPAPTPSAPPSPPNLTPPTPSPATPLSVVTLTPIAEGAPDEPALGGGDTPAGEAPIDDGETTASPVTPVPIATSERTDPGAPSAFTRALPTLANVLDSPWVVAGGFGFALLVMLLLAIPSELLTSTLASSEHRLGAGYRRAQSLFSRINAWFVTALRSQALGYAILISAMAIIFALADPAFGWDAVTARLVLSTALSLFLVYYVGARVTGLILWWRYGVETAISMVPTALLLAAAGVALARLIDFAPGFLIGLALGVSILSAAPPALRMRAVLISVSVMMTMALASWLLYSTVTAVASSGTVWEAFLIDTLVAITAEGLTGLAVVLLPLVFFDGRELWDYSKRIWAATYLVVVTAFAVLVLPASFDEFSSTEELVGWLIPVVVFGVVALSLWWWLRREPSAGTQADEEATQRAPVGR